jgi:hypothetical protein
MNICRGTLDVQKNMRGACREIYLRPILTKMEMCWQVLLKLRPHFMKTISGKGKAIPLQAWTDP